MPIIGKEIFFLTARIFFSPSIRTPPQPPIIAASTIETTIDVLS